MKTTHELETQSYNEGRVLERSEVMYGPRNASDTARPLLEARLLDVARIAVYRPQYFDDERQRLIKLATQSYIDGNLMLQYDGASNPSELIIDFIDDTIAMQRMLIESGDDRSMFNELLETHEHLRDQVKALEGTISTMRRERNATIASKFDVRNFLSTLLTDDELVIVDQKLGLTASFATQDSSEIVNAQEEASNNEFVRVVQRNWPLKWLEKIHLVKIKPPRSAEVAIIAQEKSV